MKLIYFAGLNTHMNMIVALFVAALVLRLISLFKSGINEKKLKQAQAVEYGKKNSKLLVLAHTLYYIACITEATVLDRTVNQISFIGAGLFIFSMIMLWMVIFSLKDIWTVKLYIIPNQTINKSFIFKYVRHPNYFLNIIPELIAIALVCQAWYTLVFGLPLYCIPLTIRIIQEEKAMKAHFADY
jgi:isoprenylcysteine carboxyl methyltransferase (ICMT) family protein YpbQ